MVLGDDKKMNDTHKFFSFIDNSYECMHAYEQTRKKLHFLLPWSV